MIVDQTNATGHGFSSPRAYLEFLRAHPDFPRWKQGRRVCTRLSDHLDRAAPSTRNPVAPPPSESGVNVPFFATAP